jgi:LysM repeat protein
VLVAASSDDDVELFAPFEVVSTSDSVPASAVGWLMQMPDGNRRIPLIHFYRELEEAVPVVRPESGESTVGDSVKDAAAPSGRDITGPDDSGAEPGGVEVIEPDETAREPAEPGARPACGPPLEYEVVPNDTWYSIAGRFGVSMDAIERASGATLDRSLIRVGEVLVIRLPDCE